jgi:hypothetical protein
MKPCFPEFRSTTYFAVLLLLLARFSKHNFHGVLLTEKAAWILAIIFLLLDLLYGAVIRKGTFARYDYGLWGNLRRYGRLQPPPFDLRSILESLPMWMAYGGLDALADVTDVQRTIKELRSTPETLYIGEYGHIDFVMSVMAKDDVYVDLMRFLRANGWHSSY